MFRKTVVRLCAAMLVSGGLWLAYAQFGQTPAKQELVKVKDDLYVIHNDYVPGNSTALITNEGVVLVDDKFEVDHDSIMAELKKVTNQPVKYVINTHHHADHSGSNAKMQGHGAIVVASEEARENMVDGKQPGPCRTVTFERMKPDIWLGGKHVQKRDVITSVARTRMATLWCYSRPIERSHRATCSRSATRRRS